MTVAEASDLVGGLQGPLKQGITAASVAHALQVLSEHYYDTRKAVSMIGVSGAPDWKGYETAIWQLGERMRPFLKARRDLRGHNELLDGFARILREAKFGKGRQIYAELLGEFGDLEYATDLKCVLEDTDVVGHVVRALCKLQIAGCEEAVGRIMHESRVPWIRKAAKRYLQQFPTS